jgi:hypothetical protein
MAKEWTNDVSTDAAKGNRRKKIKVLLGGEDEVDPKTRRKELKQLVGNPYSDIYDPMKTMNEAFLHYLNSVIRTTAPNWY